MKMLAVKIIFKHIVFLFKHFIRIFHNIFSKKKPQSFSGRILFLMDILYGFMFYSFKNTFEACGGCFAFL